MAAHVLDRTPRLHRRSTPPILAALRQVDFALIVATLALSVIGLVMVYSASKGIYPAEPNYFLKREIAYAIVGFIAMIVFTAIDYRRLEDLGYYIYGVTVVALVGVIAVGHSENGSQRWISFGGVQFQPSEFAVLAVICAVALYLARHRRELNVMRILALCVMTGVPMLLVVKQPDLGTAILLGIVLFVMLYFGGVRARFLFALIAIAVLGFLAAVALHVLSRYQLDRLTAFLHQSTDPQGLDYNVIQSKTAIGSGGLTGTGLFKGAQTNLNYVPIQYADFIFSAIGEQLGFVGSAVVIALYGLVAFRVFRAIQTARDELGRLICAGILAFVVFSVFENVGMASGIMPITGIPLPFISYGGSALVAFFCAIGLVLNVEMRRSRAR
ncbi:MAG: rod shape-determining protein RodA [Acidimicrobiales bacterium]